MNKNIILLSALMCTFAYATDRATWLEIKPSYFIFSSSPMKHIYNHGAFEIQGSISAPVRDNLDLYGSVGYRKAWGHALNTCEKTTLSVIPIDFGVKPIFNICECARYFFAVGPRYFYFHQRNRSPYVDCKINNGNIGLFVNTGVNVLIRDCFLFGVFGEYSYEKKKICPNMPNVYSAGSVQIGGFAVGASVGVAF